MAALALAVISPAITQSLNGSLVAAVAASGAVITVVLCAAPGLGAGAHRCLGRHVARLELRIMLEELLGAIPDMRLRPGVRPERTYGVICGVRALPVEWWLSSSPRASAD